MKLGDLICYNCAGMKDKTLGMILKEWFDIDGKRYLMIMWAVKGQYMPRESFDYYHKHNETHPSFTRGHENSLPKYLWYDDKDYFSVISESR